MRSALAVICQALAAAIGSSSLFAQPASLVSDINQTVVNDPPLTPGPAAVVGDLLYFTASDEANGRELWRSDGTDAGTRILLDVFPGPNTPGSGLPTALGELLLFSGNDGAYGAEIWRSDGTGAGTQRVTDSSWSSGPSWLGALGGRLLFRVPEPTTGPSCGSRMAPRPAPGSSRTSTRGRDPPSPPSRSSSTGTPTSPRTTA